MARRSTSSATSPRAEADPIRRGRGFTILELLVVIGIVVAIGAIALPFTLREIDRRREAEAFDRFGLLCRMARTEARTSGVPVVIVVDESGVRVSARRLDPRDESGIEAIATDLGIDEAGRGLSEVAEDGVAILASWAQWTLPDGCRCEPPPDPDADSFSGVDAFGEMNSDDLDLDLDDPVAVWEGPTRLVLFLPDGAAITTRDVGVRTSRGWRPITIDPYGGRPTIGDVVDPMSFDGFESDDADDPSVTDDDDATWEDDRRDAAATPGSAESTS